MTADRQHPRVIRVTDPPRTPVNYRKRPPPGEMGKYEVVDLWGRWHMLPKIKPMTWRRRLKAWLGLREPLSMVAGDFNLPVLGVVFDTEAGQPDPRLPPKKRRRPGAEGENEP